MKLARIKLDALKIFLLAFNKFIPSSVSQKPKQIKIKGKKLLGSYLLIIIFSEKIGNSIDKITFIILENFLNTLSPPNN